MTISLFSHLYTRTLIVPICSVILLLISSVDALSGDRTSLLVKGNTAEIVSHLRDNFSVKVLEDYPPNTKLHNEIGVVVEVLPTPGWMRIAVTAEVYTTVEQQLKHHAAVELIEPIRVVQTPAYDKVKLPPDMVTSNLTDDPRSGEQWALQVLQAPVIWGEATGKRVKVGVIDTGVDFEHEDLVQNIHINVSEDINGNGRFDPWPATVEVEGVTGDLNGQDEDGNGYADDVVGYDVVDQLVANFGDALGVDPIPMDEHGHGTSVSGVIAATRDNSIGITGLAFDASIVAIRAFDVSGNAEDDDIANAIMYGIAAGCDILNCSFGDSFFSPIIQDAVIAAEQAGVIVVTSSGNAGGTKPHYPGNLGSTISVGATTESDGIAFFSVRGSAVDIVAPGTNILTTDLNNAYHAVSGTSFATPYVVAGLALAKQLWPDASPQQLKQVLLHSAVDLGEPGWDERFANGRLDLSTLRSYIDNRQTLFASIDAPNATALVDVRNTPQLFVSAGGSEFAEWTLSYGIGLEPQEFVPLASGSTGIYTSNPLSEEHIIELGPGVRDTMCVIQLTTWSTSGRQVQDRLRVRCVANTEDFGFAELNIATMWNGASTIPVVEVATNWPSWPMIEFGGETVVDRSRSQRQHVVPGPTNSPESTQIMASMYAEIAGEVNTRTFTSVDSSLSGIWYPNHATSTMFQATDLKQVPAYLLPEVVDLNGNGKPNVVVNDWSSGVFGNLQALEWDNDSLTVVDEVQSIWIPRAVGETNGDGRPEVLVHRLGAGVLFQSSEIDNSPFADVLYADTLTGGFWASNLHDVDNDGLDEIIARSDAGFYVLDYQNGAYIASSTISNPTAPGAEGVNLFGPPVSVAGDIDGDGKIEVVFGDKDSDIIVAEYAQGDLTVQQSIALSGEDGGEFLAIGNIDGLGAPEIISLSHQPLSADSEGEYAPGVWTLRVLQYSPIEGVQVVFESRHIGVKAPNPYRSGLVCADVNSDGADDIVVSMFPHTYVFAGGIDVLDAPLLEPLWYHPISLTNSIVVYDFSGDSHRDLLFGTGVGLELFEQHSTPPKFQAPHNLQIGQIDATSVDITWQGELNVDAQYGVWIGEVVTGESISLSYVGSTTDQGMTISALETNRLYVCAVAEHEQQNPNVRSGFAQLLEVLPHVPYSPISANWQSASSMVVYFDGALQQGEVVPSAFEVSTGETPAIATASGSQVFLQFDQAVYSADKQVLALPIRDAWDGRTNEKTVIVTSSIPEAEIKNPDLRTAPLSFEKVGDQQYQLTFPHDASSAGLQTSSFALWPTGSVESVDVVGNAIVMSTAGFDVANSGVQWSIHASNITFDNGRFVDDDGEYILLRRLASVDNDIQVFPSPADFSKYSDVSITGLRGSGEVVITTLTHEPVRTLSFSDVLNVYWNGRDNQGQEVPSGVYLFRVETRTGAGIGDSEWKKIAVKR